MFEQEIKLSLFPIPGHPFSRVSVRAALFSISSQYSPDADRTKPLNLHEAWTEVRIGERRLPNDPGDALINDLLRLASQGWLPPERMIDFTDKEIQAAFGAEKIARLEKRFSDRDPANNTIGEE